MSPEQKIWRLSEAESQFSLPSGQQVVLCYGHFNIIHPGHIRYLEHAKSLGRQLIVAVQGDLSYTDSGNSHHFLAHERALGLAWLQIVDGVLILDRGDLAEAVQVLQPNLLVLGKEFEKDRQGQLKESLKALEEVSGKVVYHAGKLTMRLQICCVKNPEIFSVTVGSSSGRLVSDNNWIYQNSSRP